MRSHKERIDKERMMPSSRHLYFSDTSESLLERAQDTDASITAAVADSAIMKIENALWGKPSGGDYPGYFGDDAVMKISDCIIQDEMESE